MTAIARAAFMIASQGAAVSGLFAATIVVGAFAAVSLLHDLGCANRSWTRIRNGWLHERLKSNTDRYAVRMYGPIDLKAHSNSCINGRCAAVLRIPELAQDYGAAATHYVVSNKIGGRITSAPDDDSVALESWRDEEALAPWSSLSSLDPAPAFLNAQCGFVMGLPNG